MTFNVLDFSEVMLSFVVINHMPDEVQQGATSMLVRAQQVKFNSGCSRKLAPLFETDVVSNLNNECRQNPH